ncbi:hypothetical protein ACFE04_005003 [Oxalis oulophora]
MSSTKTKTKTQALAILLLTIICSSTIIHAQNHLGAPPPKIIDMALPPVDGDDLAPVDRSLFHLDEFFGDIISGPRAFACMTPLMSMGGCVLDIGNGFLHKDFSDVGPQCCDGVFSATTLQCVVAVVTKSFLAGNAPLPEHIKLLEDTCAKIHTTT